MKPVRNLEIHNTIDSTRAEQTKYFQLVHETILKVEWPNCMQCYGGLLLNQRRPYLRIGSGDILLGIDNKKYLYCVLEEYFTCSICNMYYNVVWYGFLEQLLPSQPHHNIKYLMDSRIKDRMGKIYANPYTSQLIMGVEPTTYWNPKPVQFVQPIPCRSGAK